jgi:hypothetical protein
LFELSIANGRLAPGLICARRRADSAPSGSTLITSAPVRASSSEQ